MTPLEDRIRDALHAAAELPVSQQDIEDAEARFHLSQVPPAQRPHAVMLVAATATVVVAALLVWWLARTGADHAEPTNQPTPPTPTQTQSPGDDQKGIIGPPPPGTAPSGPGTGQLVAAAELYSTGSWLYADGRLINVVKGYASSDQVRGYVVRWLTPSGVEAMRSYLVDGTAKLNPPHDPEFGGELTVRQGGRLMSVQPFEACGLALMDHAAGLPEVQARRCPPFEHPEEWLPASAWKDATLRAFVPHAYQVCIVSSADPAAEGLPAEAADILLASPESSSDSGVTCWVVANSVARELADIIDKADPAYARREGSAGLAYEAPAGSDGGLVAFEPVLPHGATYCTQCG